MNRPAAAWIFTKALSSDGVTSRIIDQHMPPSSASVIIVDLVISFPNMILSDVALPFVKLGL